MKLIVGLGNPGKEFEHTRHNIGFMVVGRLAREFKIKLSRNSESNSLEGRGQIEEEEVCLSLPLTHMNHSGMAVKKIIQGRNIALTHTLIVCDDINLNFGQLRLRSKGSAGGHNGLTSIIGHLGSKEFARLRCGVGHPEKRDDIVQFVLSQFNPREKKEFKEFLSQAAHCCVVWLTQGTAKAMDQFNKRPPVLPAGR